MSDEVRNGVDTQRLAVVAAALATRPQRAQLRLRVENRWIGGAHNRSVIRHFHRGADEDTSRVEAFELDSGEPIALLGDDTGPDPVEYLLHALAACLTTSLVYAAAGERVRLGEVRSTVEGDVDARWLLGPPVPGEPPALRAVRVALRVSGDADADVLAALVVEARRRSAVLQVLRPEVPVAVELEAS